MRRDEVEDIFASVPEIEHAKLQIVMRAGAAVSVEMLIRFEPRYAIVRGREAGNQDEGRGFFIPYEEMVYIKLERIVKLEELDAWYHGRPLPAHRMEGAVAAREAKAMPADAVRPPSAPIDPAEIAKQNLLKRLRAARSVTNAR